MDKLMPNKPTNSFIQTKLLDQKAKIDLISGGVAGVCSITLTHPLERVKLMRLFGTKEIVGKNIVNSIITLVKVKGVSSVLRGNGASCIREFPNAA